MCAALRRVRWSNCLIYAATRRRQRGGYLMMRPSRFGWWPHFLWLPRLGAGPRHFIPIRPRPAWMKWIPRLVFRGAVVFGHDDPVVWERGRWRRDTD